MSLPNRLCSTYVGGEFRLVLARAYSVCTSPNAICLAFMHPAVLAFLKRSWTCQRAVRHLNYVQ
jgi:hypothetical protein